MIVCWWFIAYGLVWIGCPSFVIIHESCPRFHYTTGRHPNLAFHYLHSAFNSIFTLTKIQGLSYKSSTIVYLKAIGDLKPIVLTISCPNRVTISIGTFMITTFPTIGAFIKVKRCNAKHENSMPGFMYERLVYGQKLVDSDFCP